MSWPDSHRGQVAGPRYGRRLLDDLSEPLLVADQMVGRERSHDRVRVASCQHGTGQAHRCARVLRRGLYQDVRGRHIRQLAGDSRSVRSPGNHVNIAGSRERADPVYCGLQQRPVGAGERVQELGRAGARERPEPGAAAACQNRGVEHLVTMPDAAVSRVPERRHRLVGRIRASQPGLQGGNVEPDAGLNRDWRAPFLVDLRQALVVHRRGPGDPAFRIDSAGAIWRTSLTPDGPGTMRVSARTGVVTASAWGPGASWLLAAL